MKSYLLKVFVVLCSLQTFVVSAETVAPDPFTPSSSSTSQSQQYVLQNGFSFPVITHTEDEAFATDVLFFYTPDVLAYFDNDYEKLVDFIDGSVEINNTAFRRQDIALRRNVSGVLPLPSSAGIVDANPDNIEKVSMIRETYEQSEFMQRYNASYVTGIIRHYPGTSTSVGMGDVSGYASWISPFDGFAPTRSLAHELGHNDGLIHDEEDVTTYGPWMLKPHAIGAICDGQSSIMHTGSGRELGFLSSPLVSSQSGETCGEENRKDTARSYKEALSEGLIQNAQFPFTNVKASPVKTGTVNISAVNTVVNQGEDILAELHWQGASIGDVVQVIVRRDAGAHKHVDSFMQSFVYDGNRVQQLTIPTRFDQDVIEDSSISIELIYPHKVNLGIDKAEVNISANQNEAINYGEFDFSTNQMRVEEGNTVDITIVRQNGSEGEVNITVESILGTASQNDFVAIQQSLVFKDGDTSKTITIAVNKDQIAEQIESFTLQLSSSINGVVSKAVVQIDIVDNTKPQTTPSSNAVSAAPASDNGSAAGGSMGLFSVLLALVVFSRRFVK